jgi:hypothetical protein
MYTNSISNISGTIPTEIALLTSLTYIQMYRNQWYGTLPTELGLLTQLNFMYAVLSLNLLAFDCSLLIVLF